MTIRPHWLGVAIFAAAISAAGAPPDLLFYAPFDGAPSATTAHGKAEASVQGAISYVAGVKDQAVVCGANGWLVFRARQNFDPKQGALSVWMRPVDWEDGDGKFHFLFAASSEETATRERLLLYKYFNTPQITALTDGPQGSHPVTVQKALAEWDANTWRHYVLGWTDDELLLYVDGELVGRSPRTAPGAADWEYFTIGRDGFTPEGGHCAFDELKIFDRPLTAEEVGALWSATVKKKIP